MPSPGFDQHRSTRKPRSVQDFALEHRLPPRKVLRVIAAELKRRGHANDEPFEADLERLGVHAQRRTEGERTEYDVYDAEALRASVAEASGVRLTQADAEVVASHLRSYLAVVRGEHPRGFELWKRPRAGEDYVRVESGPKRTGPIEAALAMLNDQLSGESEALGPL